MFNSKKNKVVYSIAASWLLVSQLSYAEGQPASPVKVDEVTEIALPATTDLMGTLHSRSHVQVTAGVSGRLAWLAEPGTIVQQGDVLVKMDLLPLQLLQREQQAQIKRAQINVQYLSHELQRLTKLKHSNSASQFQLDQTQSQVDLAQADIEIAHVKLQQIDDQLQRATVQAPFDGVVTERLFRAGTDINRSEVLLKLLDTENLAAHLYVPIKYLAYVRKGHRLALSANGQHINAEISSLIPSADPRSQTFEVRIRIPQQLHEVWAAGQLVKVTVPVQEAIPSLTVHRDALILRQDGTFVVKVDAQNKVHRLPVTVGSGTVDRVSVRGDLQHGDKVAIRGAERLSEGQEVVLQ